MKFQIFDDFLDMSEKEGVLILQLGSPASPAVQDVREFLRCFLGDPRVVDSTSIGWKIVLNAFILPFRPQKVSKAYERIWDGKTFPLFKYTERYAESMQQELLSRGEDHVIVEWACLIGKPTISEKLQKLLDAGCQSIRVIPQFPQFSEATTLSAWDCWNKTLESVSLPEHVKIEKVNQFHRNPAYIESYAALCNKTIAEHHPEKLLISFHGYPLRRILAGDPYFCHCIETAKHLADRVEGIDKKDIIVTFQSKFGREQWLEPGTEETLEELCAQGVKSVAICCPAFTVDCLETDDEIGIELKEVFLEAGGKEFSKVPCINDDPNWVKGSVDQLILPKLEEIPSLEVPQKTGLNIPRQKMKMRPMSPQTKVTLKTMFIVLFLDLVGFSIIFPLFPRMLEYYGQVEGDSGLFGWMMAQIQNLGTMLGAAPGAYHEVLFGGILGSLYSIFQFIFAPILGSMSDRFGRKPILFISVIGLAVSYGMWMFASSFLMLVVARLLGGMMSGNISTATAVVADVTDSSNRSKGMATVGIAFGLGFIVGPAIGAFASVIDLTQLFPSLEAIGIHPFTVPAFIALALSLLNLWYIQTKFKESLPKSKRGKPNQLRSINPLKLFKVENYPGVSLNNMIYFLYLLTFSGMEFTLTFLSFERLGYTNVQQGIMFVYVGFVLAMVQGGYVRRKVSQVGEKKMAFRGMVLLIPGFILLAFAYNSFVLYLGLFLMAVGSAQVMPCLTGLTSKYTPEQEQGRVVGVFRSLGALSRAVGPLLACFIYWHIGGQFMYVLGAVFILLPLFLIKKLPEPKGSMES
jgi:ferrochelatase